MTRVLMNPNAMAALALTQACVMARSIRSQVVAKRSWLWLSCLLTAAAFGADVTRLDPIDVTAGRIVDRKTLDRVIIPLFVQSHAAAGTRFNQVARWQDSVCVNTDGLDPEYNQKVSARVVEIAQRVGIPASADGICKPNVEILFESSPQRALNTIAHNNDALLGLHARPELKQLTTFSRLIQAWYVTASVDRDGFSTPDTSDATLNTSDQGLSLLSSEFTSKFLNVLVIVDARKVGDYVLQPVADYIALLALTRTAAPDSCSVLPSILDLLSTACGERPKPTGITSADIAFLKSLYTTDLRLHLNLERGEIHDRMLRNVLTP